MAGCLILYYIIDYSHFQSKDGNLKKKLMPSLYEEPEAAVESHKKETEASASNSKKRRRGKKKAAATATSANILPSEQKSEEPPAKKTKPDPENVKSKETESGESVKSKKKKKNKKKKSSSQSQKPQNNSVIQISKISAAFNKKPAAKEQTGDLLKFSDDRLKAYGVNPSQFKRKVRGEKFKQQAAKH